MAKSKSTQNKKKSSSSKKKTDKFNMKDIQDVLIEIFNRSQHLKNTGQCVKDFIKHFKIMYITEYFLEFMEIFVQIIKSVLCSERTSPYTKRTLEFIVKCFKEILLYEEEKEKERLEKVANDEINGVLDESIDLMETDELAAEAFDPDQTIINEKYLPPISSIDILIKKYFLKYLICDNTNIRYNTTSLIKKTLENFSEIDEGTFEDLRSAMTDRTFDKDKSVRALAVLSLEKLQSDEEKDSVLKTLKFHLLKDPDSTVRLCALKTIEVNSDSLNCLFNATRDANIVIRRTAYSKIAQHCEILNFNSEDRHTLLMNGINEREESVREIVLKQLIPSWIKHLDNNILKFVEYLNIKKNLKFSEQLLMTYFVSLKKYVEKDNISKFHSLVFDFKQRYLDEYKLLTKVSLSEENSYVWNALCTFCKKNKVDYLREIRDNDENEMTENADQDVEKQYERIDLLDEILPDVPDYCGYVNGFAKKTLEDPSNLEEKKFVFTQLLSVGQLLRIKDIAQWQYISQTFTEIIQNEQYYLIFENYIEDIIAILAIYNENNDEQFLDLIFNLINPINNPEENFSDTQEINFQEQIDEIDKELEIKEQNKSNANMEGDNENEIRLQKEIDELENKKKQLLIAQADSKATQWNRIEKDTNVFQRCLHICYGFFCSGKLKNNVSRTPTLINTMILPGLEHSDSTVRTLSIKTLGLYCLPSVELINHFLKVFVEIINLDTYGESRIEALKFLFDFLCYHGFGDIRFMNQDYKNTDLHKSTTFNEENENDILNRCNSLDFGGVFTDMVNTLLNEPVYDVDKQKTNLEAFIEHSLFEIAVKGLCKIMDLGRFYSKEFLARLIVIYHIYERVELSLKQFIEGFFFLYAVNFKKYMQTHFAVNNPFLGAYEPCLNILSEEKNLNELDANFSKKIINFFTSMIDDDQIEFPIIAAQLLTEEYKQYWDLNLKIISRSDFNKFSKEQLETIEKDISEFYQSNADKENGRVKSADKNVDMARKIKAKLQAKLASLTANSSTT